MLDLKHGVPLKFPVLYFVSQKINWINNYTHNKHTYNILLPHYHSVWQLSIRTFWRLKASLPQSWMEQIFRKSQDLSLTISCNQRAIFYLPLFTTTLLLILSLESLNAILKLEAQSESSNLSIQNACFSTVLIDSKYSALQNLSDEYVLICCMWLLIDI